VFLDNPEEAIELLKGICTDYNKRAELFIKTEAVRYFTRSDFINKSGRKLDERLQELLNQLSINKDNLIDVGLPYKNIDDSNEWFHLPF